MLQAIIPSKTRRKILQLFFTHKGESFHLRRVGRLVDEEVNAVKRELDILEKAGVLRKEKRLNKAIYTLNTKYIFYDEFLSLFTKMGPLSSALLENQSRLGKVKHAVVSKAFAQAEPIAEQEIYLLLVGTIVAQEVVEIMKKIETQYPFELNYTVMTEEEFTFRKKKNDPFIWKFLHQPKIMIIGSESDLLA